MMARRKSGRYYPTLAGVSFMIVTGFVGVAAFTSQANLLFAMFGLLTGALVASGLLVHMTARGLQVQRLAPDPGAVDEAVVLRYVMWNRKWLLPSFGLVIREITRTDRLFGAPHGAVLHLGARGQVHAEAVAWARARGTVPLDRIEISTAFPFGLIGKRVVFSCPEELLIYPRLHRLRQRLLAEIRSMEPAGIRPGRRVGGNEELLGLREYREGDNIKHVDWKRSAHHGQLVTREMSHLSPTRLVIALDLRHRDPEAAERAISLAASAVCEAHQDGFEVGLTVPGTCVPPSLPRHGRWHRAHLLRILARIELEGPWPTETRVPRWPNARWLVIHADEADRAVGPAHAMRITAEQTALWVAEPWPEPSRAAAPTAA